MNAFPSEPSLVYFMASDHIYYYEEEYIITYPNRPSPTSIDGIKNEDFKAFKNHNLINILYRYVRSIISPCKSNNGLERVGMG